MQLKWFYFLGLLILGCYPAERNESICNLPFYKEVCFDYEDGRNYAMALNLPHDLMEKDSPLCFRCSDSDPYCAEFKNDSIKYFIQQLVFSNGNSSFDISNVEAMIKNKKLLLSQMDEDLKIHSLPKTVFLSDTIQKASYGFYYEFGKHHHFRYYHIEQTSIDFWSLQVDIVSSKPQTEQLIRETKCVIESVEKG
ncbi:MAG: hypothetical protein IPN79_13000 [Saprospiraceae bacterium]|nr:hypothetical protein [Saprospiraceae bacterium]